VRTVVTISRVDRYTLEIDGTRVRATADQEERLRAMAPDDLERFVRIMGGESPGHPAHP